MPGPYLLVILVSIIGVALLAQRFLPGVVSPRLARPVVAVLVAFLAFDYVGASRGWFASSLDWVIAVVPPGIPPEEPLLLGFLALFSVVLFELFRTLGRRRVAGGVDLADFPAGRDSAAGATAADPGDATPRGAGRDRAGDA